MRNNYSENEDRRWFMGGWGGSRGRHGHHGQGRGGRGGGERMFQRILGHGDLRYVILSLLNEKPSHGYELIKALEEKSAGHYVPSPGVIYPTLTFLEEGGYATSSSSENKKCYTITEAGKALLKENQGLVSELFERLSTIGGKMSRLREWFGKEEFRDQEGRDGKHSLRTAMHHLKAELFSRMPLSKEQQKQVAEILGRALEEIRGLKK